MGGCFCASCRSPAAGPTVCVWKGRERGRSSTGTPPRAGQCLSCWQQRLLGVLLSLGHLGLQPGVWKLYSCVRRAWRPEGGPAAVREGVACPPLPSFVEKSWAQPVLICHRRQWPPIWELGGQAPGFPGLPSQLPRCSPWRGALQPVGWPRPGKELGPLLKEQCAWKSVRPGRRGLQRKPFPPDLQPL